MVDLNATPSWKDVLLMIGGAIGICIGTTWAIVMVVSNNIIESRYEADETLQVQINSINSRLNTYRNSIEETADGN